jgi:hypothetical protein
MALTRLEWGYSEPGERCAKHLPSVIREWHRAHKLRLEVEWLKLDGTTVSPEALRRLNFWLSADGAWRCSLLPHFEAAAVLSRVLDQGGLVNCGPTSGGRWPSGSTLAQILDDHLERDWDPAGVAR